MKRLFLVPALCVLAFVGCGKREGTGATTTTNAPAASGNPAMAPVDYLGALARAKKVSEKTIDTVALNQAVQQFNAAEGRYPKDLNELVTEKYLPRMPEPPYGMKFVYDPARGEVKVVQK
jgi:hypothetical protein